MISKRIIPCLDVDKGRVVKGVNFINIRQAGDPVELARKYYEMGADELCFLDITASNEDRKATYEVIKATAKEIFIPLTVGGGVSSVSDVEMLLHSGADKVGINSAAVRNPELISDGANNFGSQCIVLAVDVKRHGNSWRVYVKGGREDTGLDALDWIRAGEQRGAGEILLTSMDGDGSRNGYDLDLVKRVTELVRIPVIASGGAGNAKHVIDVLKAGADAALLASILHFGETTVQEIKAHMKEAAIRVRV
ncbi:MAG: imidazole glycerol phosphate synthase subunit HisF [Candidatus Melainabacteria bacterium]|nr:imidazole glycerol phosphate synthase subunit HisF [Candidatus Melainabacteria bacterium]